MHWVMVPRREVVLLAAFDGDNDSEVDPLETTRNHAILLRFKAYGCLLYTSPSPRD